MAPAIGRIGQHYLSLGSTHRLSWREIGADWLIYQDLEDLIVSVQEGNPNIKEFECSVFTGEYITPLVENYLEDLENSRKDELKMQREKSKANG